MSSLWTPGGEHRIGSETSNDDADSELDKTQDPRIRDTASESSDLGEVSDEEREEMAARLDELQRQLVSAPAEVVVANHAYGLFELAAIHLSQTPPRLDDARLAVDAMASLIDGLKGRLGESEPSLQDALSQIRLAFVQISGANADAPADGS